MTDPMPVPTPVSPAARPRVWLFDVDGTLLTTDGAARDAFAAALRGLGHDVDLTGVPFAGRTDPLILRDVLARHGLAFDAAEEAAYGAPVEREMVTQLVPGRGRVLPGVEALLDRLAADPRHVVALLTGNRSSMARLKLAHYRLEHRFAFGAYGEMAADRDALARVAAEASWRRYRVPAAHCIVVGDTVHDVRCARAAGARAVAVATGGNTPAELAAVSPDLLLDDLADPDPLLAWAAALDDGTGRP